MLIFLAKHWRWGLAGIGVLVLAGGFLHYRHLVAEKERLQAEGQLKDIEIQNAKSAAEQARKSRQVKEKNVQKANISNVDVDAALNDLGLLRVE